MRRYAGYYAMIKVGLTDIFCQCAASRPEIRRCAASFRISAPVGVSPFARRITILTAVPPFIEDLTLHGYRYWERAQRRVALTGKRWSAHGHEYGGWLRRLLTALPPRLKGPECLPSSPAQGGASA